MADKKRMLLSAAIDFGTTHSGYAFSFNFEDNPDPLKIPTNRLWVAEGISSLKAPTCVLLSPEQEFMAFGYEAEDLYSEMALDGNHHDHYFFEGFKMFLYETNSLQKLSKALIRDGIGKQVPALDLFAHVIRYLKNHMLSALDTKGIKVYNKEIHWVLPVPAKWKKSGKQFMREAANKAGILTEQLTLCVDSEVALLYSQRIPSTSLMGSPVTQSFLSFSPEAKIMIIDLGGKTVDIIIYQKQSNETYKELHKPTGGPWGGTKVNEAFYQMIIKIVGASCFQKFKDDFKADDQDIHRDLEMKKRKINPESNSKVTIKIPFSLLKTFEKETGEKMKEVIQQTHYANKITCRTQCFRMEADLFKELFREPINMLVEHLQQLMAKDNLSDVSTLLMVGGFSESHMMLDAVKNAFPAKRVIVPVDAGLAVLKGAVLFGHRSNYALEPNPPGLL